MKSDNLEFILDHYKNPRNFGTIDDADLSYEEGIPSCGDVIRLDLKVKDEVLEDVKLTDHDMLEALGGQVSPIRFKCALLGLTVLKKALSEQKPD